MSESHDWAFSEAHYRMIPELRYFTDGRAPFDDLSVYLRFQGGWPTTISCVVGAGSAYPLLLLLQGMLGIGDALGIALVVLIEVFIAWLLLGWIIPRLRRRRIRTALRERLSELGIITCRDCAYDMRGSIERCPECGAPYEAP